MSQTPLLVVDNVHKIYGEGPAAVHALGGVSFTVAQGEFLALRGPSGCGKSTLLHLIGAMDVPTSGCIILDGKELRGLREERLAVIRRERIGFVFQFFNLLPTLTITENVALPMLLGGAAESEAARRAQSLLSRVGLSARGSHFPATLSGGELQRAAIARAIVNTPALLLADEPTGNLDSESGLEVMRLLQMMNEESGVTVLLATHSVEAAAFAGRLIRLRDGRVESDGESGDVQAGASKRPAEVPL